MALLILFLVPALVALGFLLFGDGKITLKEFLIQLGAQGLVCLLMGAVIYTSNTHDVEILNGWVTNKAREEVSCEHSYSCNCTEECEENSRGSESCTTTCQTCYEHSYDVDWAVYNSLKTRLTIDRIDRQGLDEPSRWSAVKIGESTAQTHWYVNYIKAAPGTLFKRDADYANYVLPEYPSAVYDYYRLNRVVIDDVSVPNVIDLRKQLDDLNSQLGAKKQVNAILVITKNKPREWFYALESKWLGGKKNDVIAVISVDDNLKPQWADVMAWTDDQMVKVVIRDGIMSSGLDRAVDSMYYGIVSYYTRKPMSDFEYLKSSIKPSSMQMTVALILSFMIAIGLGVFFYQNDVFNEERVYVESRRSRGSRRSRDHYGGPY